jgi:hypothetical protein
MPNRRRLWVGNIYNALMMDVRVEEHASPLLNASPRKLWLAEPGDIVASNRPIRPAFSSYVCQTTGVSERHVDYIVLSDGFRAESPDLDALIASCDGALAIAPYALDRAIADLAQRLNLPIDPFGRRPSSQLIDTIDELNTKTGFRRLAEDLGLPCATGFSCRGRSELIDAARSLLDRYGQAIIKIDRSSNGFGNLVLSAADTPSVVEKVDAHLRRHANQPDRYVVERFYEFASLPSAEFVATNDGPVLSYVCDQRMGRCGGMMAPCSALPGDARSRLVEAGRLVGCHLIASGYRGVFDVDGGCTREGEIVLTEANVRRTAGTHLHEIAARLVGPNYQQTHTWLSGTFVMTRRREFRELVETIQSEGLAFNARERRGVILPVDDALDGKCIYMILTCEQSEAQRMEDRLAERLILEDR